MVLSVLALGVTGAVAAAPSNGEFQDASADTVDPGDGVENAELSNSAVATADIMGDLISKAEDERVEAVVRLEAADTSELTGDRDAVVSQLKSYAEQSQQPVVEAARTLDSVTVLNQLWIANAVLVETDAEGLQELATVPGVDRIHPNFELTLTEASETTGDPSEAPRSGNVSADQTYGLDMINAPQVWNEFGNQGEGAEVAILDTGYDNDHPDLPKIDPDEQWQEFDSDGNPIPSDPFDSGDHGTHVSGTVVGSDDPSVVDRAFGVAPEAKLYHGLVIPGGGGSFAQVAGGMQYAVDEWQVDIIGMSLGAAGFFTEMIEPSDNARAAGIILTASAGNGGLGNTGSPGNVYPNFASGAVDENRNRAGFSAGEEVNTQSAWGPAAPDYFPDNYIVPNAAAPGVGVLSTVPGGAGTKSGTSMSQPHKAGLFALMVSQAGGEFDRENFIQIVEETATQPDNAPPEDPNIEYGHGIVDAYEAVSQVGPPIPEFSIGDVNEDGELSIVDAVLVQQSLAGMNVSINENLADVDRSGDITIVDAVLLQQFLAGQISDGEMVVDNLDAPDSVPGGETITVTADMENVGGMGMFGQADFRLAGSEAGLDDPNTTLATNYHELAPAGSGNHTATTTFEIDTSGVPGGEYHHGIFSGDHNATDTITITQPFFDVTSLDAPAEVVEDSEITVNATIENTGNEETTQTVEFQFAGTALLTQNVTLAPNESTQVTFQPTVAADPGTYEHGVFTNDDSLTANITVIESVFSVSNVDGPSDVVHGNSYTVNATVANTGDAADEQTIEYELGVSGAGKQVAIVSPAATGEGGPDAVQTILTNRLGSDYTIEQIDSADLLSEIDNYDTFVISRFGEEDGNSAGDSRASDFYSQLGDTQGAIYMDLETGATDAEYSNAINRLSRVEGLTDSYNDVPNEFTLEITEDHPIFSGVGSSGDTFDPVADSAAPIGSSSWTGYSAGTPIADLVENGEQSIGVSDDGLEVLLANVASGFFVSEPGDFTEDGKTVMSNAVRFVATGAVGGSVTVDSGHRETVQLDPGESTNVSFSNTATAADGVGNLSHVVSSNDDSGSQDVTVTAPDQIDITSYSAPAEAAQSNSITAEAVLEHVGTEQTTQTLTFDFGGGLLRLNETVTMSPGETMTVPLTATIPKTLDPGQYTHSASLKWSEASADIEILQGEEANFQVSGLSAPSQASQFDTFNVSATVENTGDFEDTQTVEYDFDVDVGDGPQGPSEADLAVVATPSQPEDDPVVPEVLAILESQLDTNKYNIDWVNASNIVDQMGDYDVFAVYRFGPEAADEGGVGDTVAQNFLDNLADDQGVVYLGGDGGFSSPSYPGAVQRLSEVRGDPGVWEDEFSGEDNNPVEITQDHEMWNEVGSVGDTVNMVDSDFDDTFGFDDYSGAAVGESVAMGMPSMAFNDNPSSGGAEAIVGNMIPEFNLAAADVSEAGNQTMANAVRYVANEAHFTGSGDTVQTDDNIVTIDGQPFKIAATEQVTLDRGESTTVEFEFQVPGNLPEGTYGHGVFSENDDQAAEIFIVEQSPNIEVTGQFPEDDELSVGEDLVTQATVVNNGDVAGEREIQLNVDSQVRDTVTVQLDPGEVAQVTLSTTMSQTGEFVVSVNGQDPQVVTVSNNSTALNAVTPVGLSVIG
jgi:subtilisin family serine protease